VDLLAEKHQDAELAEIVRREMGRIDSIVSQMLRFAAPAKRTFSAVRLHEVLNHSLRLVQPQLQSKAIALSRSIRAAQDVVEGDDHQLQQAFVNLFLNALEAMEPHGTLTVATETVETAAAPKGARQPGGARQLRVTIKDTGPGISAENMGRLFEPFFTTKKGGTGLGLPITRRIIEEHRGVLQLESQPNQGATFSILLPMMEKDYGQHLHPGNRQRHSLRQRGRASPRQ
jgi:signal transduction histidine kinase